jgi:hypothetical protein
MQTLAQTLELVLVNLDQPARDQLIANTRLYVEDMRASLGGDNKDTQDGEHALLLMQQLNADL